MLIFVAFLLTLVGCGGNPVLAQTAQPESNRSGVVFVGDSIFGRMPLDVYFPGKNYINGGWFGQRTDQILNVFPQILDGSNVCHGYNPTPPNPPDPAFPFSCSSINPPAAIVLLIGWNDLFQGTPVQSAVGNINQMLLLASQAGVKVYVCIPYEFDSAHPNSWMQPWDACSDLYPYRDTLPALVSGTEQAAVTYNFPIINLEWLFRSGPYNNNQCESNYTIDGIHPNDYGYQQMADFISAVLANA